MPIFTQSLQRVDYSNPQEALKKMANHIKYIQETLEYNLHNLDSNNINEIDLNQTLIKDGTTDIGSFLQYKGKNGASFSVGVNSSGRFVFELIGKIGKEDKTMFSMNDAGELIITENATLTVDGGEW